MRSCKHLKAIAVAAFGVVLSLGLMACSGNGNGKTGGVAATVNGDSIQEDDVTDYIQSFRDKQNINDEDSWGQWLAKYNMTPQSVRSAVLQQYEQQKLIDQAANEYGVTPSDDDVDAQVQKMRDHYDSDDAWNQALSQAGYTEDTYRETVRSGLEQQGLEQQVNSGVQDPSDDDVLAQAKQYAQYFSGTKRSSHILFSSDDTDKAQQVLDQINAGQISFEDAAKQYSTDTASAANGGDVGWDMLNQFNTDYANQLKALDKGQVSGLFTDQYGIEIVKCTDVWNAPDEVTSLDQIPQAFTDYIRSMLKQENQQQAFKSWFSNYKDQADIQENDMPQGLPYDVDMSKYQSDDSGSGNGDQSGDNGDQGQSNDSGQSSQDSGSQQ